MDVAFPFCLSVLLPLMVVFDPAMLFPCFFQSSLLCWQQGRIETDFFTICGRVRERQAVAGRFGERNGNMISFGSCFPEAGQAQAAFKNILPPM